MRAALRLLAMTTMLLLARGLRAPGGRASPPALLRSFLAARNGGPPDVDPDAPPLRPVGQRSRDESLSEYADLEDVVRRQANRQLNNNKIASALGNTYNPNSAINAPAISWYPGHIAKAERELAEYLKKVDVVIEVRDARIPLSTTHPSVPDWVGNKPLIIAVARLDQVSRKALEGWREYYAMNAAHKDRSRESTPVFFIDGKSGAGVLAVKKEALRAGVSVNEKRTRRGIQPRAVRAAVIGFPNVGKSALINRLLGKTMARSRNLPGVTRSLQWIRLGGSEAAGEGGIELLDSPGIIPAKQFDQQGALKLAICNDIGEASYDRVVVAAAMCDQINQLHASTRGFVDMRRINERYESFNFQELTGEQIVYKIAEQYYHGNSVSAADRILGDFRKGLLGFGSLEAPPEVKRERRAAVVRAEPAAPSGASSGASSGAQEVNSGAQEVNSGGELPTLDVGKGTYDGW